MGFGGIYPVNHRDRPAHWKKVETWAVNGIAGVRRVGSIIGPYLCERRSAKLAEMLTWEPAHRPTPNHCIEPVAPSSAGANIHAAKGEPLCERCRLSRNFYMREFRKGKRPGREWRDTPDRVDQFRLP